MITPDINMITIRCHYSNGDKMITRTNGMIRDAEIYYVGNWFNIGVVEDNMQQCIKVELVSL